MALFVEVAKRRSFSQAAAALDMPISSLSRRITLFESAMGLRLIERTTRKLALTPYGETYLPRAARLVEEAQRAFDEMAAQAKEPRTVLVIAAPAEAWLLRHLVDVVAEAPLPRIRLRIDLDPLQIDVASGGYDLSIILGQSSDATPGAVKVADLENGLFASHSYIEAHGRPAHPRDLDRHRAILRGKESNAIWRLQHRDESVVVTVAGCVSCNSPDLARRFAVAGQGIVAGTLLKTESDVRHRRLVRVLPAWRPPATSIHVATSSRALPAEARGFCDRLTKRLAAAAADSDISAANLGDQGPGDACTQL